MPTINRREALHYLIGGAIAVFSAGYAQYGFAAQDSRFRHIYLNPVLRQDFFHFLENVFHLYPENDFHELITKKSLQKLTDKEIYQAILAEIPEIRPFLSEIRYALPALKKQKQTMCEQTLALLAGHKKLDGYVEVGSTGRYYDELSEQIDITGRKVFIHTDTPTYGAADIMERGQFRKIGKFKELNQYAPFISAEIPQESIDLLTVYIGYHHAPRLNRSTFIQSCYQALRKDGILIVRDHDVSSADMDTFVALAHDVFNVGLELPWEKNEAEIRNFCSLQELSDALSKEGFQAEEKRLLQKGDPTLNTLMKFVKKS